MGPCVQALELALALAEVVVEVVREDLGRVEHLRGVGGVPVEVHAHVREPMFILIS